LGWMVSGDRNWEFTHRAALQGRSPLNTGTIHEHSTDRNSHDIYPWISYYHTDHTYITMTGLATLISV